MNNLLNLIQEYYKVTGYKLPSTEQALWFVHTELGEVYELLLAKSGGWTRNHPEDKESYSDERLAEELGDVVWMTLVAGLASGVDVVSALESKLTRKIAEFTPPPDSQ